MNRAVRSILLVVGFLLLVPSSLAGPDVERDRAVWVYASGGEYAGRVVGSCTAAGFGFDASHPSSISFASMGGRLTVFETWSNETDAPALDTLIVPQLEDLHQMSRAFDVPPGVLLVDWASSGRGVLRAPRQHPLEVGFDASRVEVGTLRAALAGVEYPQVEDSGTFFGGVPLVGPARFVASDQVVLSARGGLELWLDEATFRTGDATLAELPPYRQVQQSVGAPGQAARVIVLYTHAVLDLDEASFALPAAEAELACRGLDLLVEGGGVLRGASGRIERGGDAADFSNRELSLSGPFRVAEEPDGDAETVRAAAEGRLDAAGLDFVPLALAPRPLVGFKEVGLMVLVAAALAASASQWGRLVGVFYSRFDPASVLAHPVRARLHQLAEQRPGLILADAVGATGRPYGVVRHHARILETVGLVRAFRVGKSVHLYPREANLAEVRDRLRLEADGPARFLAERAAAGPLDRRTASRELQTRFGLSRMGAWKAIRRSLAAGWIAAFGDGELRAATKTQQ